MEVSLGCCLHLVFFWTSVVVLNLGGAGFARYSGRYISSDIRFIDWHKIKPFDLQLDLHNRIEP